MFVEKKSILTSGENYEINFIMKIFYKFVFSTKGWYEKQAKINITVDLKHLDFSLKLFYI